MHVSINRAVVKIKAEIVPVKILVAVGETWLTQVVFCFYSNQSFIFDISSSVEVCILRF